MSSLPSSISNLITPASFTGQSKFSQDFQQVLDRAVQLQSLNLQNLQNSQQQLQSQQSSLQSVDTIFSSLQKSIDTLSSSTGLASLAAHVSEQFCRFGELIFRCGDRHIYTRGHKLGIAHSSDQQRRQSRQLPTFLPRTSVRLRSSR